MRRVMALGIFFGILTLFLEAQAFIRTRAEGGSPFYWNGPSPSLQLYVNPENSGEISHQTVEDMVDYSIAQWNNKGNISVSRQSASSPEEGRNDLYFSGGPDSIQFGRGVLGVTLLTYEGSTGRLVEADIIINDNPSYSDNFVTTTGTYLGNIISHEIGHFLGLSHGQVHESTMLFRIFKGQHSLHSDDKEALGNIYPLPSGSTHYIPRGTLRGKVGGLNSSRGTTVGIFGAHVQAIASSTGNVVSSIVTSPSGSFSLSLPIDETYYLYIAPIRSGVGLQEYFDTVETEFCSEGRPWQASYFQKCGNAQKGHPQGFHLETVGEVLDVGTATIHCEFQTPVSYSSGGSQEIDISASNSSFGEAVTGFFLKESIKSNTSNTLNNPSERVSDTYTIDLTDYSPSDPSKELYLDIKMITQRVYSPLRMNVFVQNTVNSQSSLYPESFNAIFGRKEYGHDGTTQGITSYALDYTRHIELDTSTPSKNSFSVELIPQPLAQGFPYPQVLEEAFFPSYNLLSHSLPHYMVIFSLSEKIDGKYRPLEEKEHSPYANNLSCISGDSTFTVSANVSVPLEEKPEEEDETVVGKLLCGAVDFDGTHPGPGNFILILIVTALMIIAEGKRRKKQNFSF